MGRLYIATETRLSLESPMRREAHPFGIDPDAHRLRGPPVICDVRSTYDRANFSIEGTQPVGSYPSGLSLFGCYDMAGNASEWLRDRQDGERRAVIGCSGWTRPTCSRSPTSSGSIPVTRTRRSASVW